MADGTKQPTNVMSNSPVPKQGKGMYVKTPSGQSVKDQGAFNSKLQKLQK